jgi:hypothetical protein
MFDMDYSDRLVGYGFTLMKLSTTMIQIRHFMSRVMPILLLELLL